MNKPKGLVIDIMKLSPKKHKSSEEDVPEEMDFDEEDDENEEAKAMAAEEILVALESKDAESLKDALTSFIYNCK